MTEAIGDVDIKVSDTSEIEVLKTSIENYLKLATTIRDKAIEHKVGTVSLSDLEKKKLTDLISLSFNELSRLSFALDGVQSYGKEDFSEDMFYLYTAKLNQAEDFLTEAEVILKTL